MNKYLNKITQGDCLELMKELHDESVDCVISSPPYWGLRQYDCEPIIWGGDKDCEHEWGNELLHPTRGNRGQGNDLKYAIRKNAQPTNTNTYFCAKCNAWRGQLGLEPDYKLYIKHLCDIFDEVKRVLKKTGTCWVNIGDTYSGSGCGSWNAPIEQRGKQYRKTCNIDQEYLAPPRKDKTLPSKSLVGIPERFALEMTDRGSYEETL